jgi:CheY-like chemotaxis protein
MKQQFGLEVELETKAELQSLSTPLKVFAFRAVQELLFNVVKHAGVGKARTSVASSGDSLVVTVGDQGRGFDPGILTTPAAGFGLFSLRERANYIGGSLSIESAPGQGSRFTLTLPLKLGEAVQAPPSDQPAVGEVPAVSGPAPFPSSEGIRVLFADDHRVLRQGLIKLLAGQPGIQVVGEAANGREALKLVRQLRPDVVVMDITMPVMDGIEATRRIKAEVPAVHVIGLSVVEEVEADRRMRQAGAEAFVSKSASSSELLKAIYQAARGA